MQTALQRAWGAQPPSNAGVCPALKSTQATGSFVHLCHGGRVTLKVIFVGCNTLRGSNFGRSCDGEWKRAQEKFKGTVLQNSNEEGGRGQKNQTPPLLSDGKAQRSRMSLRKHGEEGTGNTQRGRRAEEKQRARNACQLFG